MKHIERLLFCVILFSLGLAGCAAGSGKLKPAGETVTMAAPEAAGASDTTEATLPAGTPRETDEYSEASAEASIPPELAAWLPPFELQESWEGGAQYQNVIEEALSAYIDAMKAAGFAVWTGTDAYVFSNGQAVILLRCYPEEVDPSRSWTANWYTAPAGSAEPDLESIQTMLPEDRIIALLDQTPAGMETATGIRRLICVTETPVVHPDTGITDPSEHGFSARRLLMGPGGCAWEQGYYGGAAEAPLWADLDADGVPEYVYWTYGPTSGLFTVALYAYGLEQGYPVVKASSIWNLRYGDFRLEQEGDRILFCWAPNYFNQETGQFGAEETRRIPLRVEDGWIWPETETLPQEISLWGGPEWGLPGSSFAAARTWLGDRLLLDRPHCLIWRESYEGYEDSEPETFLALTTDGVTVTGMVSFRRNENGQLYGWRRGVTPIPVPEDPEALAGLTEAGIIERLGPCHFREPAPGGVEVLGYLTEDGRMLCVELMAEDSAVNLSVPVMELLADSDTVLVWESVPSVLQNGERWETFLTNTAAGIPDAVTLQLAYPAGIFQLKLRYDGELYYLEDEGREMGYPCLLVSRETDSSSRANYRTATHYILSEDPEMTWERYFAHMLSSTWDPDFPETRMLFTVYSD